MLPAKLPIFQNIYRQRMISNPTSIAEIRISETEAHFADAHWTDSNCATPIGQILNLSNERRRNVPCFRFRDSDIGYTDSRAWYSGILHVNIVQYSRL